MPSRRTPIGVGIGRSAVWPVALGVALGAVLAADPPRSFGERIGPLRPGPGRLVGIPYAPEGTPRSEEQRVALSAEKRRLGIKLDETERRTPEALRQSAILALAEGDADRAVKLLERALEDLPANHSSPHEAVLRSDLSAAHLQRYAEGDAPISSLAALDEAARAAAGGFSGVRFNHAVALERLYLGRQAKRVWQVIEAANLEPGWASEATQRIRVLDAAQVGSQAEIDGLLARIDQGDRRAAQELVQREPQRARELATRDALWNWADAIGRGDLEAAEKQLAVAELLSAPLAEHGDRVALDTVAVLRAASPDRLQVAARGLRAYKEGFRLYRRFDHEEGIATLETARKDLAVLRLPQELEVDLYRAYLESNAGRPGAKERVASVANRSAGRGYPGIDALNHWFDALSASRGGRVQEQAHAYREALAIYSRLGEAENVSNVEALLADAYGRLGRREDALESYLSAAAVAPRIRDPYRRRLFWGLLTSFVRHSGLPRVGLAFQEEMYQSAAMQEDPTAISEPLIFGASLMADLGDFKGAEANLAAAWALVTSEPDREDRERTKADLARVGAGLRGEFDPATSILALDHAVGLYAKGGQGVLEMTARAIRAKIRTAAADLRGAEEDLEAITLFARRSGEGWLSKASDEERYTFGQEVRSAFAAMVRFQIVEARLPWRAFIYHEMVRELLAPSYPRQVGLPPALSLLDVPELKALRAELPKNIVLLEFGLFEDRVVSWLVMKENVSALERPADRGEVTRLVNNLDPRSGLRADAWKESSARLFDLLLRPLANLLPPGRTLVVIPDGALADVPWSGLWDRRRRRYVIEDRAVLVNPSTTFYLRALTRSKELGPAPQNVRVLALGDPAFDPNEWKRFERLPGAMREAREVGRIYGKNAVVLTGEAATWEAFKNSASDVDVIHLGTHAVLDPSDPFRSYLLFSDSGAVGARSLRDLATLDLRRARLVVLGACKSASGSPVGEGIAGQVRPILAAGVPTVLGELWAASDLKSQALFSQFYCALFATSQPLSAVRKTQLRLLKTEDATSWAGIVVLGTGT